MRKSKNHELNLWFPDSNHLIVSLERNSVGPIDFTARITPKDREEIRWYLEVYAAGYTTEVDDAEARRIEAKLPKWGLGLFKAAFKNDETQRLFQQFRQTTSQARVLTISAKDPVILSLPWELLRDTKGTYLFNENPRISIRRRVFEPIDKPRSVLPVAKARLRLLFVTSRPVNAPFIDPRSESNAVINALEQHAPGRIEVEFLRPATFRNFAERLADKRLPAIDVVHFDGHGAYDFKGTFGDRTPNTGYLMFERESGLAHFVSPKFWHERVPDSVPLVILSACKSATISESEGDAGSQPMGSVAYGLTALGAPVVLAMPYSLLVETAGRLFGEFYRHLAEGKNVGAALDNARYGLMRDPEKHEVQRGSKRVRLLVHDWFLPTLYQRDRDVPLLNASVRRAHDSASDHASSTSASVRSTATLPELPKAGFFGRQRELWDIERWFIAGTRLISITGFGGQGKTYLAVEAGRWLQRTGMFEYVVFVNFAAFQGVDARGYALATLSAVLGENLPDAKSVLKALRKTPTLLILDNLEDLVHLHEQSTLNELLSAAKTWSECGESRVLLTTRAPNFEHADYDFSDNLKHRALPLTGLDQEDALNYFQSVWKLPPEPKLPAPDSDALLKLFEKLDFHPLSIQLLAVQLKTRAVTELGARLESLLTADGHQNDKGLLASLALSLDGLDPETLESLTRLGVFQRGAMEHGLMLITEAELRFIQANNYYDILDEVSIGESRWTTMRDQLEAAALITFESLKGVFLRYVRFHPTLAPLLWSRLPQHERDALTVKHRLWYYQLSSILYTGDRQNPDEMRAIARCELPNLLHAAQGALEAGEEWAVRFSSNVVHFLYVFALKREAEVLIERIAAWKKDETSGDTEATLPWLVYSSKREMGLSAWQLAQSTRGERLLQNGDPAAAAEVFWEILDKVGDAPTFERCHALAWLGRCLHDLGRLDQAELVFQTALALIDVLADEDIINRRTVRMGGPDRITHLRGVLQSYLGDALLDMGRYEEAQAAYYSALAAIKEFGDTTAEGSITGHLGNLALRLRDLPEAIRRYEEAITIFQRLNQPEGEAVFRHQLGLAHHQSWQWEAAEEAYRESARIQESLGNLSRAAGTWDQLGQVSAVVDKPQAAEAWFRKALEIRRQAGDSIGVVTTLHNLATFLQHQPNRLSEARQLAEEALAIKQTLNLDPGSAVIWNEYISLAQIAQKQNKPAEAKKYRHHALEAWRSFAGRRYELERWESLIVAVIATVFRPQQRSESEPVLAALGQQGKDGLVTAIRRIFDGERNAEALCESLGVVDSDIVEVILNGINDPINIEMFANH